MADHEPRTLVVVFLRGGLDGVNAVVPHFEDEYHRLRPALGIDAPKAASAAERTLALDDRFGLNPGLEALLPAYRNGRLAVVHAIGSDDPTRSHFEAQDQMEHGGSYELPAAGGWIARWLRERGADSAFSALAFSAAMPESLRGAPAACAVQSLDEMGVVTRTGDEEGFLAALGRLHSGPGDPGAGTALVRKAAGDSLALLARMEEVRKEEDSRGEYPDTDLARSFSQVERLVRKGVGLSVATIDHGGFDTHFGQGLILEGQLRTLGDALAAFDSSLGDLRDRVTTVCVTEFGRRLYENASLGTDHGRASCAFVLGGGVKGGRVAGRWPGLAEEDREGPGDLKVTTDYRDLLWEILSRRFGAVDAGRVFPHHRPAPVGVIS